MGTLTPKTTGEKALVALMTVMLLGVLIYINTRYGYFEGHIENSDYTIIHTSGRAVREGLDIYDPVDWETALRTNLDFYYRDNQVFIYPLPAIFLFLPFSYFPYAVGRVMWMLVGELLLIWSVVMLSRRVKLKGGRQFFLFILFVFLFQPVQSVLHTTQHTYYFLFFFVAALLAIEKERDLLAGALLSLTCMRPNLMILILPAILIWAAWKRRWGVWLGGLLLGGALLLASEWLRPGWLWVWLGASLGGSGKLDLYSTWVPSMWGMIEDLVPAVYLELGKVFGVLFTFLQLAFSLWWLRRTRRYDLASVLALIIPASLFLSPYTWNYDQTLLLIPLLFVLSDMEPLGQKNQHTLRVLTVMVAIVLPYAVYRPLAYSHGRDVFSALLSLTVWGLAVWRMALDQKMNSDVNAAK